MAQPQPRIDPEHTVARLYEMQKNRKEKISQKQQEQYFNENLYLKQNQNPQINEKSQMLAQQNQNPPIFLRAEIEQRKKAENIFQMKESILKNQILNEDVPTFKPQVMNRSNISVFDQRQIYHFMENVQNYENQKMEKSLQLQMELLQREISTSPFKPKINQKSKQMSQNQQVEQQRKSKLLINIDFTLPSHPQKLQQNITDRIDYYVQKRQNNPLKMEQQLILKNRWTFSPAICQKSIQIVEKSQKKSQMSRLGDSPQQQRDSRVKTQMSFYEQQKKTRESPQIYQRYEEEDSYDWNRLKTEPYFQVSPSHKPEKPKESYRSNQVIEKNKLHSSKSFVDPQLSDSLVYHQNSKFNKNSWLDTEINNIKPIPQTNSKSPISYTPFNQSSRSLSSISFQANKKQGTTVKDFRLNNLINYSNLQKGVEKNDSNLNQSKNAQTKNVTFNSNLQKSPSVVVAGINRSPLKQK